MAWGPRWIGGALGGLASAGSESLAKRAGPGAIGWGAGQLSRGLGWYGSLSAPAALTLAGGLGGATLGGAYGAFSDDTSVIGGAIKGGLGGASLTRASLAGEHLYGVGRPVWDLARSQGLGRGQAAMETFKAIGTESKNYIAATWGRAYNGIKGMRGPSSAGQ